MSAANATASSVVGDPVALDGDGGDLARDWARRGTEPGGERSPGQLSVEELAREIRAGAVRLAAATAAWLRLVAQLPGKMAG